MGRYLERSTLKVALSDSSASRDDVYDAVIAAVEDTLDTTCGRTFSLDATATARTFSPHGSTVRSPEGDLLLVDDIGSTTGLVVEEGGGMGGTWQLIAASRYEVNPLRAAVHGRPYAGLLLPGGTWSDGSADRVRVTAQWGWPAVPAAVRQAALIWAQRLWKRRDSPEGVLGSADWGVVRVSRIDPDIDAMLAPLRAPGLA